MEIKNESSHIDWTASGIPVTSFSLATTERWGSKEDDTRKEHTEWHNCVAWRKLADICGQYLKKGTKVLVQGKIRREEYKDKDGTPRQATKIHIYTMEILTPKPQSDTIENMETDDYGVNPEHTNPARYSTDENN